LCPLSSAFCIAKIGNGTRTIRPINQNTLLEVFPLLNELLVEVQSNMIGEDKQCRRHLEILDLCLQIYSKK
jgi:hypothetical protein